MLELVLSCGVKGYQLSLKRLKRPVKEYEDAILDALDCLKEEIGCSEETLHVWPSSTLFVKLCRSPPDSLTPTVDLVPDFLSPRDLKFVLLERKQKYVTELENEESQRKCMCYCPTKPNVW